MKSTIIGAFFTIMLTVGATHTQTFNLAVDCSADDNLGQRFCYELKEKIRSSHEWNLVNDDDPAHFKLSILTMDDTATHSGNSAAVAVALVGVRHGQLDWFIDLLLLDFGRMRIGEEVENTLAFADKDVTTLMRGTSEK